MQNQIELDKLVLEGRKRLMMTGVEAVDGFSEQLVNLTVTGCKVKITGEKLKITNYNKTSKSLSVEGLVNEIKYNAKKIPFFKKIFK